MPDLDALIEKVAKTRLAAQQAADVDRAASIARNAADDREATAWRELQQEIRRRTDEKTPRRPGDRIPG